ncbi:MAG: RimK domain-containing protein ATP-grasp [Pseudonocardia sp.]|nr:RimK domain-containing protein ATP-grasp [Pseudonocardia sp.]
MILLFGYGDDPSLALVRQAARDDGAEVLVVDQRDIDDVDLRIDDMVASAGFFAVGGARVPLSRIDAVYARPLAARTRPDPLATARGRVLADLVVEWLDVAPGRIVNRPGAMSSNASKPYQAQVLAECGFTVPETLVTNVPDEVRAFAARHGAVVFKSTSGVRSIVRKLDAAALTRLNHVRVLPTQFQECVSGVDVRVHVIGAEVFATEITSTAVDYRYAGRDGATCALRAVALEDELAARCVQLAQVLDLPFAGIDLRRTPDGEVVCFEVNPMPGYSFYEANTAQPISAALVRHLRGAEG